MRAFFAAAALAGAAWHAPASAAEVGVSVQISQPGVYGRVDIGRVPQPPQVVLPQPVIIAPPPPPRVVVAHPLPRPEPVYMWVPPGHRKDWRRHCAKYNACGVPVYFVRHDWYDRHVHPRDRGRGGKGDRRDDDDRGRRDGRDGRGPDHGRGHGRGRD
jgi:hypothetical protein